MLGMLSLVSAAAPLLFDDKVRQDHLLDKTTPQLPCPLDDWTAQL